MKPVDQTIIDPEIGNCVQACLASILELPLDSAPNFMLFRDDTWWPAFQWFCYGYGYDVEYVFADDLEQSPKGYAIAGGQSPRYPDGQHAVVALDGKIVHDPHPSREGIMGPIKNYKWLVRRSDNR